MSKRTFKYRGGDRTVEEVSRNVRESGGDYDSYLDPACPFYKAREGYNIVRILPRTWDDVQVWGKGWFIKVFLHRNIGPDDGIYLCLKMKGEHCPICEARTQATSEGEFDLIRAQARILCWVIDRENERNGPQIFSMPITLFREISSRSIDKNSETVIYIDDPEKGYDVSFTREGTTKKTKYIGVEIARKSTYLSSDEDREGAWLDFIENHPLPEMLVYYDADHIEKIFCGGSVPSEELDKGGSRRRSQVEADAPRPRRTEPVDEVEDMRGSRRARQQEDVEAIEPGVSRRRASADPSDEEGDNSTRLSDDEGSSERRTRYRSKAASEPSEEPSARPTSRLRGKNESVGGSVDEGSSPTDQVRARLSRMRQE